MPRERWLNCIVCQRWRLIEDKAFYKSCKRQSSFSFSCDDLYRRGCETIADHFEVIDKKNIDFTDQYGALQEVKQSFIYLLDKLPKTGGYNGVVKSELLNDLNTCTSLEMMKKLQLVYSNVKQVFRGSKWDDVPYFSSKRYMSVERLADFIEMLDRNINWDNVDVYQISLYKKGSLSGYKRRLDMENVGIVAEARAGRYDVEYVAALEKMVAAQANVVKVN